MSRKINSTLKNFKIFKIYFFAFSCKNLFGHPSENAKCHEKVSSLPINRLVEPFLCDTSKKCNVTKITKPNNCNGFSVTLSVLKSVLGVTLSVLLLLLEI